MMSCFLITIKLNWIKIKSFCTTYITSVSKKMSISFSRTAVNLLGHMSNLSFSKDLFRYQEVLSLWRMWQGGMKKVKMKKNGMLDLTSFGIFVSLLATTQIFQKLNTWSSAEINKKHSKNFWKKALGRTKSHKWRNIQ